MFTWPILVKKPKGKIILVLAPHIDDEIIGCGGVIYKHIQNGDSVTVVYFTRGDRGNKYFSSDNTLSELRKMEAQRANRILGIKESYFFDFEDGTTKDWGAKKEELRNIYMDIHPDLVYLPPYYDLHIDHRKTNWLFKEATESIEVCDLCIYEVWTPINPNIIINITQQMDIKLNALYACKTQIDNLDYALFIKSLNSYRSFFAMSPQIKYAECFYLLSANEYFSKFNKNEFDYQLTNKYGGIKDVKDNI